MGDTNQICRLCLDIVSNRDSEAIKETGKELLEILLVNIDLHISDSAVACNRCLLELQDCYDFKTGCLNTDNYVSSFSVGTNIRVDIKKVFQMQIQNEANVNLENVRICRLCVSLIEDNNALNYSIDMQDMIGNCLPEVDLSTVDEPIFCQLCLNRMKRLNKFMKTCREVEKKIQKYSRVAADHCVSDKIILRDLLRFEKYHTASESIEAEYSDLDIKCPKNEDAVSIECEGVHIKDEIGNEVNASGDRSGDCCSQRKRPIGPSASNSEADMDNVSKQICRLCLQTVPDGDSEAIVGAKKGMLKVLLINIDFDISNEAVACNTCLVKVQVCFDFKSNCLYVDDYKGTFLDKVVQEGVTSKEVKHVQICQLCMSSIEDKPLNWTTDSKDAVLFNIMIRKCLPEVTLDATNEPLICKLCVSNMYKYDEFMEICHQAEQRIKSYRDVAAGLGVEVALKDLLEYENCHTFSQPICTTTKEECLDAESDTNVIDCPQKENIASIKLEEVHIKEETEDTENMGDGLEDEEMGDTFPLGASNITGKSGSLKRNGLIRKSASKGRRRFFSDDRIARHSGLTKAFGSQECTLKTDGKHILARNMSRRKDKSEVVKQKCAPYPYKNKYKTGMFKQQLPLDQREKCITLNCEKCPYKTDRRSSLWTHNLIHKDKSEVVMHKCDNCEFETRHRSNIIRHMLQKHRDPNAERRFKCDQCSYDADFKFELRKHSLRHKDKSEVKVHRVGHHDPKEERIFKCDNCPYKTDIKAYLRMHILIHKDKSEVVMHKCDNCEFETKYQSSMVKHMIKHRDPSAEKKFKCYKCPYETNLRSSFCNHSLRHKDKSQLVMYKCENCKFETKYKESLIRHMMKHQDKSVVVMHKCDNCDFETKYQSSLVIHMMMHRDPGVEKTFKCDKCSYETNFKYSLLKHNLKHKDKSEVETYKCDHCEFETKYKSDRKKHMLRHHYP